jgi:xanthine dehydrogenase FAD-binding subunit
MPRESQTTYLRADSLDQAWQAISQHGEKARPVWVSPQPPDFTKSQVEVWLDLSQLPIAALEKDEARLKVGAGVPLSQLMEAQEASQIFAGIIQRATRKTAHHGLRNLATLGAVLQAPESAPELSAALLACDPLLIFFDGEERALKLTEFWGNGDSRALPLRLEFSLENSAPLGSGIQWVGRSPMDKAIVTAASVVTVQDERIDSVCLAAAGDGISPRRLKEVEEAIEGKELAALDRANLELMASQAVDPAASYRASSAYQNHLTGVLTWRALTEALGEVS